MKTLKKSGLSKEELIQAYRQVLRGRRLDERLWQLTGLVRPLSIFLVKGQKLHK